MLLDISQKLAMENKSLEDFCILTPEDVKINSTTQEMDFHLQYNIVYIEQELLEEVSSLTENQQNIFWTIVNAVINRESRAFCIDSPGGYGNSFR